MSNPQITIDLAKILEQINQKLDGLDKKFEERFNKVDSKFEERFNKVDSKFERIDERLNKLEINQVRIEEYTKGQFKSLNDKIDGLSKRVDSVEFTNRGIFIAVTIAVLGGFAKVFGLIGENP